MIVTLQQQLFKLKHNAKSPKDLFNVQDKFQPNQLKIKQFGAVYNTHTENHIYAVCVNLQEFITLKVFRVWL